MFYVYTIAKRKYDNETCNSCIRIIVSTVRLEIELTLQLSVVTQLHKWKCAREISSVPRDITPDTASRAVVWLKGTTETRIETLLIFQQTLIQLNWLLSIYSFTCSHPVAFSNVIVNECRLELLNKLCWQCV